VDCSCTTAGDSTLATAAAGSASLPERGAAEVAAGCNVPPDEAWAARASTALGVDLLLSRPAPKPRPAARIAASAMTAPARDLEPSDRRGVPGCTGGRLPDGAA